MSIKKIFNNLTLISLAFILFSCSTVQNIDLITKKAQLGDKIAQYQFGMYYENQGKLEQSIHWYTKSAKQNYSIAQNQLGNIYLNGIKKDLHKSFYWYQESANNNYFDGINNLAYMYDLGLGIEKNQEKAIELYKKAASKGSIRAMFNLGIEYRKNNNLVQAYKWLELARYYTTTSKDMSLKWTIREQWDELHSTMNKSEIIQAQDLAKKWSKKITN